jgi:hypothetical protein
MMLLHTILVSLAGLTNSVAIYKYPEASLQKGRVDRARELPR